MSKIKSVENLDHFNSLGNEYLQYLEGAQLAHRTARAKHTQLTALLKDKGVKFQDIRNFLYNEAKRCHLYKKNFWNDKADKFTFPPKNKVKHLAWANAISRYCSWLSANYSDYGVVVKPREVKKEDNKVVVRKDKDGNVTQSEVINKDGVSEKKTVDAIVEELSPKQIQSILEENWSILGQFCKAKDASVEFNALMDKLGLEDYQI